MTITNITEHTWHLPSGTRKVFIIDAVPEPKEPSSVREYIMIFGTSNGPIEVDVTEELWDACAADRRTDVIRHAVREHPRGAEIELELQASHDRLAELAGDHKRRLTPSGLDDILWPLAADDPALAGTLRAEEELVWTLIGELTDIEIAIGDAMDTASQN